MPVNCEVRTREQRRAYFCTDLPRYSFMMLPEKVVIDYEAKQHSRKHEITCFQKCRSCGNVPRVVILSLKNTSRNNKDNCSKENDTENNNVPLEFVMILKIQVFTRMALAGLNFLQSQHNPH